MRNSLRTVCAAVKGSNQSECQSKEAVTFPVLGRYGTLHDAAPGSPRGMAPQEGSRIDPVELQRPAETWDRERKLVAKIEWDSGAFFPWIGFLVTDSEFPGDKVAAFMGSDGPLNDGWRPGKRASRHAHGTLHAGFCGRHYLLFGPRISKFYLTAWIKSTILFG